MEDKPPQKPKQERDQKTGRVLSGAGGGPGRPFGSRNKIVKDRNAAREKVWSSGRTPLDVIIQVMDGGDNGRKISDRQFAAACAAAPFVHPKLAATVVTHRDALSSMTDDQLTILLAAAERVIDTRAEITVDGGVAEADDGEQAQDLLPLH